MEEWVITWQAESHHYDPTKTTEKCAASEGAEVQGHTVSLRLIQEYSRAWFLLSCAIQ